MFDTLHTIGRVTVLTEETPFMRYAERVVIENLPGLDEALCPEDPTAYLLTALFDKRNEWCESRDPDGFGEWGDVFRLAGVIAETGDVIFWIDRDEVIAHAGAAAVGEHEILAEDYL